MAIKELLDIVAAIAQRHKECTSLSLSEEEIPDLVGNVTPAVVGVSEVQRVRSAALGNGA